MILWFFIAGLVVAFYANVLNWVCRYAWRRRGYVLPAFAALAVLLIMGGVR
jgi:hypothetical protein